MDEAYLLAKRAEILAIEAEIQAMVALNQYRLNRGETIAYDDGPFFDKAAELKSISRLIMEAR